MEERPKCRIFNRTGKIVAQYKKSVCGISFLQYDFCFIKEKSPCLPLRHGPRSWPWITGRNELHYTHQGACRTERAAQFNSEELIQTSPNIANEVFGLMRDRSERPQCCLGVDAGAFEGPLRSTQRTSIRVMDKPPSHRGAEWKSNNGR